MSEPTSRGPDDRDELITKLGPVELHGRRRREDDPVVEARQEARRAWAEFVDELVKATRIDRLLAWVARKLG